MSQTICIFGDSIVWGASDNEKGGWVSRFDNFLGENNYDIYIYNLGIAGDTSEGLLQRFETERKARNPSIIIFAIGINDSSYFGENGDCMVSIEDFQKNLQELIAKAKNFTNKVIFLGLTYVNESKTLPVFRKGESSNFFYSKANIKLYNGKIEEIARENNLDFIEIIDLLSNADLDEDGLHPNSKGHEKIFLQVKDFLNSRKYI